MNKVSWPLNLKKFLRECCTTASSKRGSKITHVVDGRLLRSYASADGLEEYFVVKLKNPLLIQRYMIILRARPQGCLMTSTNILRYEKSVEACDAFLEMK